MDTSNLGIDIHQFLVYIFLIYQKQLPIVCFRCQMILIYKDRETDNNNFFAYTSYA